MKPFAFFHEWKHDSRPQIQDPVLSDYRTNIITYLTRTMQDQFKVIRIRISSKQKIYLIIALNRNL